MTPIPFIFIHLGEDPSYFPDYVNIAIKQCRKWNPDNPIYFLSSRKFLLTPENKSVNHIYIDEIVLSEKHTYFLNTSILDINHRGGFWKFTTERLFVLESFCIMNNIT